MPNFDGSYAFSAPHPALLTVLFATKKKPTFGGFLVSSRSLFQAGEDVVELTKFRLARFALSEQNFLLVELMGLQSHEARYTISGAGVM